MHIIPVVRVTDARGPCARHDARGLRAGGFRISFYCGGGGHQQPLNRLVSVADRFIYAALAVGLVLLRLAAASRLRGEERCPRRKRP